MHTRTRGWLAAGAMALLAGCATDSTPPPRAELARAELAVSQAEQANASRYAPVPLSEARDRLQMARTALANERNAEARRLAEQAQANAELAVAQTQAERSEQLAAENLKNVETLREELRRKQDLRHQPAQPGMEGGR